MEELVKRLREHNGWALNETLDEAADAIEQLSKLAEAIPHVCECCVGCELEKKSGGCDHAFVLSPKRAMQYLIKPRWIPVTELPPEGETYGDTTFSVEVLGTEGFTYRKAYYNFKYKVWLDGNEEQEWPSITHWMPISTPPKEET